MEKFMRRKNNLMNLNSSDLKHKKLYIIKKQNSFSPQCANFAQKKINNVSSTKTFKIKRVDYQWFSQC